MMRKFISLILLALSLALPAVQAALIDRGEGFIYDDVLDVTWAADANINGFMWWETAVAWADGYSQTHSVYGTFDDWRLPTTLQPDPSCLGQSDPGGGFPLQGNAINCTGSEMGHLYNVDGINSSSPGLFTNLQSGNYWSGTEYAPDTTRAWHFFMNHGVQVWGDKSGGPFAYALAVRDGDIAPVPVPAAVWLFGSSLIGLGWLRKAKRLNV